MISFFLSLLLTALASISCSVQETCDHHYSISIFNNLNPLFWNHQESWRTEYTSLKENTPKKRILWGLIEQPFAWDAWHISKFIMVLFFMLSVCSLIVFPIQPIYNVWVTAGIYFVCLWIAWVAPFSLFYNKILIRKK